MDKTRIKSESVKKGRPKRRECVVGCRCQNIRCLRIDSQAQGIRVGTDYNMGPERQKVCAS